MLKSMPLNSHPVSCQSPSFVLLQRISPFFETVASAHVIESIATPSMANLFFGSSFVPASFPFFGAANENANLLKTPEDFKNHFNSGDKIIIIPHIQFNTRPYSETSG
ncbi:MAG: hypothetical protein IJ937_02420, partial [Treponema sp.]|nr:hypothetical protein [Treponema sp.]